MNRIHNCCHSFYLHIAKLFYAVASIDGEIRDEEYQAFKEALKKEWLDNRNGKKEVVDEVIKCFQEIQKREEIAQDCFREFLAYKKEHEKLFTKSMKNVLWEVSCVIADSVNKKNKSELIILVHLGKSLGLVK